MSKLFDARHPGICGDCDTRFDVGDLIGYDDTDTIVCADCLRGDRDLKPAEKVCPTCNLIHAGKCDEW